MSDLSAQLAAFRSRLNIVEARQISANPNDILFSAIGQTVLYGCKVTEGDDDQDLEIALEGQATGDDEHWNPEYSATPTRPFQYGNIAQGMDGAFRSGDLTAEVATQPATGLGRYDIAYIYVGPGGAGFAVATGTPSADVKTDFDTYGLDGSAYGQATIPDPELPIGAFPIARIYVEDDEPGIPNSRIADLRVFFIRAGAALDKYNGVGPPGVNDDASSGYSQGSKWYDTSADPIEVYICVDATIGAAIWQNITIGTEDLGTMAVQNANAVNISGGAIVGVTINNCVIGGITPAAATFTTATMTGITTLATGSAAAPSLTFTGATDKGLYDGGTNVVALAARGLTAATFTNVASAVNYPTFSGSATGNKVTIGAAGSDTNVGIELVVKGLASVDIVGGTSTGLVDDLRVTTGADSYAASETRAVAWVGGGATTVGRIGMNYEDVAGSTSIAYVVRDLYTSSSARSGISFAVYQATAANPANFYAARSAAAGAAPAMIAQGSDSNINAIVSSKGTSAVQFYTNNVGSLQVEVSHTASAVNFLRLSGGVTGSGVALWARGSDTNVGIGHSTKGGSSHLFSTNDFAQVQLEIAHTASAVNYPTITGAPTGDLVRFQASGSDSNIGIYIMPKGTGAARIVASSGANSLLVPVSTTFVNYWRLAGSATAGQPALSVEGSDTNIPAIYSTKGTGEHSFYSHNFAHVQFKIVSPVSAVNFIQATGRATAAAPYLWARGSDTNVGLSFYTTGTGTIDFFTDGGGTAPRVVQFGHTASGVNYWQFFGSATTNGLSLFAGGSDTNISFFTVAKGSGVHNFTTGGSSSNVQFRVGHLASPVNYTTAYGSISGAIPGFYAEGSDTNIALGYRAKGAAGHVWYSASGSTALLILNNTTSAVNTLSLFAATTGNAPTVQVQGSDTNIALNFLSKGTGAIGFYTNNATPVLQFSIQHTTSAVNYLSVQGATTGNGPLLRPFGSDTNISAHYGTKGSGAHNFYTSVDGVATLQLAIAHTASAVNAWNFTGSTTGNGITVGVTGSDTNVAMSFVSKGSGNISFMSNAGSNTDFRVIGSTSTIVNFIQVWGSQSTGAPLLEWTGSDTNVTGQYRTKGTGAHEFTTGGYYQFIIGNTTNAVNYVEVTGGTTGNKVNVSANGSNSNIDLGLSPKGSGVLDIVGTATAAAAVASTHKLAIKISGATYYVLLSNV